jgi:hypothetical protein
MELEPGLAELITELRNGKPPHDIPRSMVPRVREQLNSEKSHAINEGDTASVRQLQAILTAIRKVEEQRNERSNSQTTKKRAHPVRNNDFDTLLERFINGESYAIVNSSELPQLIVYTKGIVDMLIERKELIVAQRYENISHDLVAEEIDRDHRDSQMSRREELERLLRKVELNVDAERVQMETDLDEHDKRTGETRASMNAEFEQAMANFDERTNGDLPAYHKKFSSRLLNLREVERYLLRVRRFEEAGYVRLEADEQERRELHDLMEQYHRSREVQKGIKQAAHSQKLASFDQKAATLKRKIETDHQKAIDSMEQSITNLQKRIQTLSDGIDDTVSVAVSVAASRAGSRAPSVAPAPSWPKTSVQQTEPPSPRQKPKTIALQTTKVVYRPLLSKWRIRSPQSMSAARRVP